MRDPAWDVLLQDKSLSKASAVHLDIAGSIDDLFAHSDLL
jgi:hypothetical protein